MLPRYMKPVPPSEYHAEAALHHTLASLFTLGLVGHGALMDAGANDGLDAVYLATLQPERRVIAVEPIAKNAKAIGVFAAHFKNLKVVHGGLSSTAGIGAYPASWDSRPAGEMLQVNDRTNEEALTGRRARKGDVSHYSIETVDQLMLRLNLSLALAHWDVEGAELDVLQGARATLKRDAPLFTVESYPESKPRNHRKLLHFIARMGYEAHEIREICGIPLDCRNFLCVPERLRARFAKSRNIIIDGYRAVYP